MGITAHMFRMPSPQRDSLHSVTVVVVKNKNRDSLESFTPPYTWRLQKMLDFSLFLCWKGVKGGCLKCCLSIQQGLEAY